MEWVNKAGGLLFGVVIWVLLAGAVMTVTARYTYVFEDPNKGGNPSQRAAREVVANDVRNSMDDMLTESAFVPIAARIPGPDAGRNVGHGARETLTPPWTSWKSGHQINPKTKKSDRLGRNQVFDKTRC